MSKLLNVSSSPHVRSHETTHSIMLDVAIAMLPATAFGVYHFGMHALLVLIVTVAACVLSEYVYEKLMKKPSTISDCSALVTGLILALNMPPEIPVWIPALGGIFAIIVVKQLYGGLGQNFMNPALAARCFLLISFAGKMTNFSYSGFDGVSGATPLAVLKSGGTVGVPAMFVGNIPGTIGEVSVIALLIGAAYLLAKKVISIRIPGTYILTVVVFAILFGGHGFDLNYIAAHLCGGVNQGARFKRVHHFQPIQRDLPAFASQINYLTADHPLAARSMRQHSGRLNRPFGINRIAGTLVKHRFESKRQKSIPGQKRVCLSKFYMAGGLAAPHIVIIHTGQIIVDQRIGVDHFHRTGKGQCGMWIFPARFAECERENRANSFAAVF